MNINQKTKVDLVCGFLGAGKTTFIKKYSRYCKERCNNLVLVENEFGKAGVDTAILKKEGIPINQLVGGCICCGQKVNFHNLLIELSKSYSHIIVEPSGVFTLEDFYDIMESPPVAACCELGSILMIVDPNMIPEIQEPESEIFYSQLAGAGIIILSKMQMNSNRETVESTALKKIKQIMDYYQNSERDLSKAIFDKDWDELTNEDYDRLYNGGFYRNYKSLKKQDHTTLFQSTTMNIVLKYKSDLDDFLSLLLKGRFGQVIRVKGYLNLIDGTIYEINCTRKDWSVELYNNNKEVDGINIIGRNLRRKEIENFAINTGNS